MRSDAQPLSVQYLLHGRRVADMEIFHAFQPMYEINLTSPERRTTRNVLLRQWTYIRLSVEAKRVG